MRTAHTLLHDTRMVLVSIGDDPPHALSHQNKSKPETHVHGPFDYPLGEVLDELLSTRFKLVEARSYACDPSNLTGVRLKFLSAVYAPSRTSIRQECIAFRIFRTGLIVGPWQNIHATSESYDRNNPEGPTLLRIHLTPESLATTRNQEEFESPPATLLGKQTEAA